MPFVRVADFRDKLQKEIDGLESGLLLAAEITGISERGLRRILSGGQEMITDEVFDKLCVAFDWDWWEYEIIGLKEPDGD